MTQITIYKVQSYDINTDQNIISRRMMTKEGAKMHDSEIIPETALLVSRSVLIQGEEYTEIDFNPQS
jgi:hypothetical protein